MRPESIKRVIDTAIPLLGILRSASNKHLVEGVDESVKEDQPTMPGGAKPKKSIASGIIFAFFYIGMIVYSLYLHISCKNRHIIGWLPAILFAPAYLLHYVFFYKMCSFATRQELGLSTQKVSIPTATASPSLPK